MVGSKHHPASDSCLNTSASESSLHRPLHCASLINNYTNLTSLRHTDNIRPRTEGASGSHDNSFNRYFQRNTKLFVELQHLPNFDFFTLSELIQEHQLSHLITQLYPSRDGSGLVLLFSYYEDAYAFLNTYFYNIMDNAYIRPTYSRRNRDFYYQQPTYERRPRTTIRRSPNQQNEERLSQPQILTSPPKHNTIKTKTKPNFIPPPEYLLRPTYTTRSTQTTNVKTAENKCNQTHTTRSTQTTNVTTSENKCNQTRNNMTFETWTQTKITKDAAVTASPIPEPSLEPPPDYIEDYVRKIQINQTL